MIASELYAGPLLLVKPKKKKKLKHFRFSVYVKRSSKLLSKHNLGGNFARKEGERCQQFKKYR